MQPGLGPYWRQAGNGYQYRHVLQTHLGVNELGPRVGLAWRWHILTYLLI